MKPVIQVEKGLPLTPTCAADSLSHHLTNFSSISYTPSHTGLFALDQLRNRWRTLDHFTEYLSSLIRCTHVDCDITIFAPRCSAFSKSENLFDSIYCHIVDENERTTLTKVILFVASTIAPIVDDISHPIPPSATTPALLQWWTNLYNIADSHLNISVFNTQLISNPRLDYDLAQVAQSAEGRNLFMKAAVTLLGERLLGILKMGFSLRDTQRRHAGSRRESRQTYMHVMAIMKERGIRLDESWMRALLDSM